MTRVFARSISVKLGHELASAWAPTSVMSWPLTLTSVASRFAFAHLASFWSSLVGRPRGLVGEAGDGDGDGDGDGGGVSLPPLLRAWVLEKGKRR